DVCSSDLARDILTAVNELDDLVRARTGPLLGRLRIGVIPTVAPYLLPEVITALQARYPGLDLRPREAVTQKLLEDLSGARLDAAIVALPISEPGLVEMPLFEEEFVLVRPPQEADHPVPSAQGLREMRLLLLEEGHCFRDQALAFCAPPRSAPRDMMEGSSLSTLVQMVSAGIGVTLVPEMAVPVETRSARAALQRLARPRPPRQIGMIWRRSHPRGDQMPVLGELVREAAQPSAAPQPRRTACRGAGTEGRPGVESAARAVTPERCAPPCGRPRRRYPPRPASGRAAVRSRGCRPAASRARSRPLQEAPPRRPGRPCARGRR